MIKEVAAAAAAAAAKVLNLNKKKRKTKAVRLKVETYKEDRITVLWLNALVLGSMAPRKRGE
jgi:transposase-like protein